MIASKVRHGLAALAVVIGLLGLAPAARAVDVSQLSPFESDPCVMNLSERNIAKQFGAPENALVDACDRAHGNMEVAWDFLTRTWVPPDVSRASSSGPGLPAMPLAPLATGVALLEMLLAYAVLGTPVRAMRRVHADGRWSRQSIVEAGACLVARLLLGLVLLTLLQLPLAIGVASLLLLAATVLQVRAEPGAAAVPRTDVSATGSAAATLIAGVVNDAAGNAALLLALALAARGHGGLLVIGVLVAVLSGLTPLLGWWKTLRLEKLAMAGCGVAMAVVAGTFALLEPSLARVAASGGTLLSFLLPVVFAAVLVWYARKLMPSLPSRG